MKNHTFKIMFSHEIVVSSPRGYYSLGEGNMCLSIGAFRVLSMVRKRYHWQDIDTDCDQ